jgi:hypothetical protein
MLAFAGCGRVGAHALRTAASLSGAQLIGVVFLEAASGTCRSLRGSGDGVGGQSIDKLI